MKIFLRAFCIWAFWGATAFAAETDYLRTSVLLDQFIQRELREKGIDGAAVALIDDQKIVWSRAYGHSRVRNFEKDDEEAAEGEPMRTDTPIRAGSVSKLFTAILIMREVEAGRLDLDAPITKYLPDFHPTNRFDKPITLRHVLAHRSGIIREPPYGNYFETNQTSLARMVKSLNDTEVVYEPGERTKYSNAAIGMAGYIAAESARKTFPTLARKSVFEPLGMNASSFDVREHPGLAEGLMWTLHGTKFRAPIFEFGMAPAASLTTTVLDLGKFAGALIADANNGNKLLRKETLEKMWKPQFAAAGEKRSFGIGFSMAELDGHRRAGHNGAVYGFATDFSLLPDEKLGVVVVVTRDFGNTVASRISTLALRAMLAAREGKPLQIPSGTQPIRRDTARQWIGSFSAGATLVELLEFDGKLHLLRGAIPEPLRWDGTNFMTDGLLAYGLTIQLGESTNELKIGSETYFRQISSAIPAPPRPEWLSLMGEYGWDHDVLYIFEKDGKLWSLIEWFEFAPIEPIAPDLFRFPDSGSYAGEKLVFKRDKNGQVKEVVAANITFVRRKVGPADGGQLKIRPTQSVAELTKKAAAQTPPREKGEFKAPDLVELATLDPTITLDIRYATTNNFLNSVFYAEPRAFLQRPAAEAVLRANAKLREHGYGLRVFDGYRPWSVTKVFWDATPGAQRWLVADPSKGSRHNRGCAVDVTLYELATGAAIEMTGTYDETTDRSYPNYPGGTSRQRWHRELLRRVMESEGFTVYKTEWWHFDYKDWRQYPILNVPFSAIK